MKNFRWITFALPLTLASCEQAYTIAKTALLKASEGNTPSEDLDPAQRPGQPTAPGQPPATAPGLPPVTAPGLPPVNMPATCVTGGAHTDPYLFGKGSASDPYLICTPAQLDAIRDSHQSKERDLGGLLHFRLVSDIDLATLPEFSPGNNFHMIRGSGVHFDGGGFTVSGLKLNVSPDRGKQSFGFFDSISGSSQIRNLKLSGATLKGSGSVYLGGAVGSIHGQLPRQANNTYSLINVSFSGSVSCDGPGEHQCGGLVGATNMGTTTLGQLRSEGTITCQGGGACGGLIGANLGGGSQIDFGNASSDSQLTCRGGASCGGLLGLNRGGGASAYIEDGKSFGQVSCVQGVCGGLVGRTEGGRAFVRLRRVSSEAEIRCENASCGGLVGGAEGGGAHVEIASGASTGSVSCNVNASPPESTEEYGCAGLMGTKGEGSDSGIFSDTYILASMSCFQTGSRPLACASGVGRLGPNSDPPRIARLYVSASITATGEVSQGSFLGFTGPNSTVPPETGYYCNVDLYPSGCGTGGRTTAQLRDQATFVGWNFSEVWQISPGQLPTLR